MRFFDARLGRVFGGRYLVHSTQYTGSDGTHPRQWHIAYLLHDGSVDDLPGVGLAMYQWATQHQAERFAEALEAGRITLEALDYNAAIPCAWHTRMAYAVWLLDGEALCSSHCAEGLRSLSAAAGLE